MDRISVHIKDNMEKIMRSLQLKLTMNFPMELNQFIVLED